MASSLHSNFTFLSLHPSTLRPTLSTTNRNYIPICCGPRSNRGPLVKGRILSIEAIQAVQTLKRLNKSDLNDGVITKTVSRLIKFDLLATLKELLRQDRCDLALRVFTVFRSEYKPDLSLHAVLVSALGKKGMREDIDRLICDLEAEGVIDCDDKGLVVLIKKLIEAERRESTVKVYRLMKRSGWGHTCKIDEYVGKVLSRGLRRLGEKSVADEIDKEIEKDAMRAIWRS